VLKNQEARVKKSHKHTKRGNHYQTMAEGYQILKSPLANSYNAAAAHYRETDPPFDPAAEANGDAPAGKPEPDPRPH
jgi:hypothetical protein